MANLDPLTPTTPTQPANLPENAPGIR